MLRKKQKKDGGDYMNKNDENRLDTNKGYKYKRARKRGASQWTKDREEDKQGFQRRRSQGADRTGARDTQRNSCRETHLVPIEPTKTFCSSDQMSLARSHWFVKVHTGTLTCWWATDGPGRETDRETDRQAGRETGRHTVIQGD